MNDENKALMRRFVTEYQTGHDDAVLYELVADDFVDHSALPGLPPGRDGVKAAFDAFHAAFAGFRVQVHDQVAEDDRVVTRKSFHGRHVAEYMGIPPTGRDIRIDVIDIVRIADGRIVEHWNVVDQLGFLRQLGVLPS
ncbi:MAG TPA: ester cyclase [Micromonosporaceae bacterium]|nr:ester cyclase [Micromonosporaceae bacterium]